MKTDVDWDDLKEFLQLNDLEEQVGLLSYGFFSVGNKTEVEGLRIKELKESFEHSHIYEEILEFIEAVERTTFAWDKYSQAKMNLSNRIPLGQQMFSSEEEKTLKYHIRSALDNKKDCKPSLEAIDLILKTKSGNFDFIHWKIRWKKIKKDIENGSFDKLETLLSSLNKVGYVGFLLNPEKGLDLEKESNAAIHEQYKHHDQLD